jgi:hypothetical protein
MSLDLLQKIKQILSSATVKDTVVIENVVAPVEHKSVTDSNGNTYDVASLEVGNVITMDSVPLPEGEYTIEGKKITTDKDGIITSVKDAVAEDAPIEQASEAITTEQVQSMIDKAIADFKKSIDAKMSATDSAIATNHKATTDALEVTASAIQELSVEPLAEPLHNNKHKVSHSQIAKNEARKKLSEIIQKHKQTI